MTIILIRHGETARLLAESRELPVIEADRPGHRILFHPGTCARTGI